MELHALNAKCFLIGNLPVSVVHIVLLALSIVELHVLRYHSRTYSMRI